MKQTEKTVKYKKFNHARLEDDLIVWLKEEKNKYKTWNLFFRELKKRYVDGKIEHQHVKQ